MKKEKTSGGGKGRPSSKTRGKKNNSRPNNKAKGAPRGANLSGKLVAFLERRPERAFSFGELTDALQIGKGRQTAAFNKALDGLLKDQKVIEPEPERYQYGGGLHDTYEGVVDYVNPKFAYIIVEGLADDVWVSAKRLKSALDGDRVIVKVFTEGNRRKRLEGEVKEVLERRTNIFSGKIEVHKRFSFVVPDGRRMHHDIFVSHNALNGAQDGQKVVVELTQYPGEDKSPEGRVVRVLGQPGEHNAEMHAIMVEFGLPFDFPDEIEQAAEAIDPGLTEEEFAKRRDFRDVPTFTIDPLTAKDFDDALSLRRLSNGNWEVGIHIADVTHYVKPDTILEEEAYRRATSVYLVDRVVPMLPERLSNGLCSLRPNEVKLTFSAVFELDDEGRVHDEWYGRTVINSDRRFTYEEAQEALETGEGDFVNAIQKLNDLAKKLKARRFKNGAISFETPEFVFDLDENGKPLGLTQKVRKDAHKLVEEFMLLANEGVATFVHNLKKGRDRLTMIYRVHDSPDPEKVENFAKFCATFGYKVVVSEKQYPFSLNELSQKLEGKPEQYIIESQAVRTMAKAKYTTEAIGHYGLSFKHYTHFTSPIRRYPDMMAHRLLQHYIDKKRSASEEEFEAKCVHSSERERKAVEAERASVKYKQVEFMQNFLGQEMWGVISGVTEWGIYVEAEETRCEGMVRLANLKDDHYVYDEQTVSVTGKMTNKRYRFGDRVKIVVEAVDMEKRNIDMLLAENQ